RGNNILGLVREVDDKGLAEEKPQGDGNRQPFTTLGYANGSGYREGRRPNLTQEEAVNPDFKQEATIPLGSETHAGEDVAIYADGAGAYLVRGSMEQNWIFAVMSEAMRLNPKN
ncbi:MAG TPA: alkaline phosphatase, partial [Pyrinomonadaceae bacterium]|nr:alkaline phosphatase [Pyrinomonadaceae bacterium]